MNLVILTGTLTRDPELRTLPSGRHVATFTVATEDLRSENTPVPYTEYHPCVAWGVVADAVGEFIGRKDLVTLHGRLQTRQWDDDAGKRHWKTEVVVSDIRLLKRTERAKILAQKLTTAAPEHSLGSIGLRNETRTVAM